VLLVDIDSMLYAAAGAAQLSEYALVSGTIDESRRAVATLYTTWGEANKARSQALGFDAPRIFSRNILLPVEHAVHELTQRLTFLLNQYPQHEHELYVSGYGNYREVIARRARYKWNRVEAAKPQHFGTLRKYAIDELGARMVHWCEPDDVLATRAAQLREAGRFYVIASIDKDLAQVPGVHHSFDDMPRRIEHRDAVLWFYCQAIAGDSTDGIAGVKGIGATKAGRRLAALGPEASELELWAETVNAYADAGHPDPRAIALETARLVWLCDCLPLEAMQSAAQEYATHLAMPTVPLWVPPDER
jgi:hypothetical protein